MPHYRGQHFEPRFTDAQMYEIGKDREWLEERSIKRFGYPELPEEPQPRVEPKPIFRPRSNITYQINAESAPAFKELEEKIALINGRLTKYFEQSRKKGSISPF